MRWVWLPASLLLVVAALAGCGGGGSHKSASTATGAQGGGGSAQRPNGGGGPTGRLTLAEYRAIVREYRRLRPLQQSQGGPAEIARGRRACAELRDPSTELVARVRADCDNAITFFLALHALEQAGTDCTSGSQRDRIVCGRDRYSQMAQAIHATTNGGTALNDELQRRRITGLCADSIGMTPAQVASYRQAETAAQDAVDAISVADAAGFARAQDELASALDAGSSGDPLTGIVRACRPPSAKPAPAPRRKTPKPKTKPLPRVPDGSGIKA